MDKVIKRIKKEILLLKEGAIIGLIIGIFIYLIREQLPWLINKISLWWGPFTETQLLLVIVYLSVSAGVIFDFFYKPKK